MNGSKIKELRKRHKMTQEELGNLLGVKKATIQKYESGGIKNLKQETIKKLCDIFGVKPIVFFESTPTKVKREFEMFEDINLFYGEDKVNTIGIYLGLTEEGQEKVDTYVKDMLKIYGARDEVK